MIASAEKAVEQLAPPVPLELVRVRCAAHAARPRPRAAARGRASPDGGLIARLPRPGRRPARAVGEAERHRRGGRARPVRAGAGEPDPDRRRRRRSAPRRRQARALAPPTVLWPTGGARGRASGAKRGTEESNLALRFWRPPCYRYTSPPGIRSYASRGTGPDAASRSRRLPLPRRLRTPRELKLCTAPAEGSLARDLLRDNAHFLSDARRLPPSSATVAMRRPPSSAFAHCALAGRRASC